MKNHLLLLCLLCAGVSNAQIVAGIYQGTLVNDSGRTQRYELALSEYRGNITGYAYTTFVNNDTFYYSIKRVKGTRLTHEIRVEDVEMIANNFPERAAKGVRQINHIELTNEDTLRTVRGSWETTKTKNYYSLKGASSMKQISDSSASTLISHLKELEIIRTRVNYQDDVAAVPPKPSKAPVVKEPKKNKMEERVNRTVAKSGSEERPVAKPSTDERPVAKVEPPVVPQTLSWDKRQIKKLNPVSVTSDSLVVAFYDNGTIDGDTISIYINGQPLILSRRLTAAATKITVAVPKTGELELTLVAENLGSIPPNTGLVVIKDGGESHQLSFSADLKTNATLIIRRQNGTN